MNYILIQTINILSDILVVLVLAHVILSYFMNPYHPLRSMVDRLVDPLLNPIRRVIPPVGMIDFSPLILIILVQLLAGLLVNFLS